MPAVTRLTEAHDLAAEDRIGAWLALGGHAQAAAELEAMVAARPLRERRWGQLIVATYRCGRQADALRAYQRCRAVLAEELGLEPGPGAAAAGSRRARPGPLAGLAPGRGGCGGTA